jgi:hypothetical protein
MAEENGGEKPGQVLTFPPCTVDVWLTEDELAELTRDAAREGVTLTTFVRRVVFEEMERLWEARRKKRARPTNVHTLPCTSDSSLDPPERPEPNR